ncbi:AAA family ATPase [Acetobacterium fimetarium]|uniref:AAA family ATPase n=1 Tax=Acetobacterium fimetarium TaxID=52691 RepID=A0ABR6WSF2_9FIRM|nr:AAA domain-containing protein [Acetobacterium fimetarium]MBC3803553.1 AAA family ATPase [Acetobacterium fimetarium]
MDHFDLKHCTQEDIVEFEIISNLRDGKKLHFKDNEPVKLISAGGSFAIAATDDSSKTAMVKPVNSHYLSIMEGIIGRGRVYLAAVVNHAQKLLQVSFKQYAEEKNLSYSIHISEEFFSSVRKNINLQNVNNPKKDIENGTLYSVGGYTYAVVGTHIRADENQKFKQFIIAGSDFYIQVAKVEEALGQEYYVAEKVLKRIKADEYCFFLAKGELKYTTEREKVALETKAVMESLSDDTYVQIWNAYGEIERQSIMHDARESGALKYTSFEASGREYRFDIISNNRARLTEFAKKFERGDILAASIQNPFDIQREDQEFEEYISKHKDYIANVRLSEDIVTDLGYMTFTIDDQQIRKLTVAQQGYIFVSIMGDKKRLNRRENARLKIESHQCPMPHLAAVLEGKSVSSANNVKRHFPALSPSVKKEIFTKKGHYQPPTEKQEMAIAMALNTPDIALIQGPPGTGKTTVITAILKRLNEITDPTGGIFGRNLVTAFQHDAVQNAIDRIEILGLPAIKFGHKYNESEQDIVDINASIQGWINDRLSDLYVNHSDLDNKKYLVEFNKIYLDYLYSANSIEQTLDLLERARDLVDIYVSLEILDELSESIAELQLMTGRLDTHTTSALVRAVRRLPTTEVAFSDNGKIELQRVIYLLGKQSNKEFEKELAVLQSMQSTGKYDFEQLRKIRKELLVKVLPKANIFTAPSKKDEIVRLLGKISDYLLNQIEGGKDGEDLVVMQYMQSLEEDPIAVKRAILNYSAVNGATNQQVMRKEISDLKDGEIVYDNVLVDEAARSNPLDLFIPLSIAKDRIILVGDHRQLPHIIDDQIVNKLEDSAEADVRADIEQKIKKSMFAQLFTKLKMLEAQDGIKRTITLDKQFRMHPKLGTYIDTNFYSKYSESEHVGNGLEDPTLFAHELSGIEGKACVWYDLPYDRNNKGEKAKSKYRVKEAEAIACHIKTLMQSDEGKNFTYGIITFYREQVNVINKALADPNIQILVKDDAGHYELNPEYKKNNRDVSEIVRVGTVDSFQGMEFDVVYLSMVRSNDTEVDVSVDSPETNKQLQRKYGFLMYENRLCVAMSRQKRALICVGDSGMVKGPQAVKGVAPLVEYYKLCKEDEYGKII